MLLILSRSNVRVGTFLEPGLKKCMRKIFLVLILFLNFGVVHAYSFSTKMRAQIIESNRKVVSGNFKLKVLSHGEESADAYPVGTVFDLRIKSNKNAGLYTNPKMKTEVTAITLPDGTKLDPRGMTMLLKTLSSTKSAIVPFYRLAKLASDKEKRRIKLGSEFDISKTKPGKKNIIAVLDTSN